MDLLISILLGVVQGATEFIPISSSGHLILVRDVLGIETVGTLGFDAVLQLATAFAVLIYFKQDFINLLHASFKYVKGEDIQTSNKVLIWALILGTIPAAILGLLLQDYMETTFRSAGFVVVTLVLGSILFFVAERLAKQDSFLTIQKGIGIGFFQALALFPGTSRSGATIAGGLIFGLTREQAARFSFLLSFPIIFGSGIVKVLGISGMGVALTLDLILGALSAFVVGILAIHYLLKYLRNHTLGIFIWYRLILAAIVYVTLV